MKFKKIVVAIAIAFATSAALAQNAVLQNEYIKAGVNETMGTLGSGGNTSPGLLYNNAGSSTWNTAYDYLTPGSPFEGFTVRMEDSAGTLIRTYTNNNAGWGSPEIAGAWVGTPSSSSAVWAGSTADFNLQHTYSLPSAQKYIDINTRIEALIAMPKLWFGRFIDPDAVAAPGDSSATDNVLGYGAISRNNVVFSEATVSRYALGLYSAAPNVKAGITGWSTDPKDYYANGTNGYGSYTDNTYGNGDDTIGLGFLVSGVSIGDIVNFRYAYIFGPSAFGASESAVAGGAGGGEPGTVPGGGTLVDVGSATDSASSGTSTPPAPTVVSTSTAIITVSDVTAVDSSLPVITGSIAHHVATEGSGKQTIARETTTSVTTPMRRDVTTLTRTTSTWSDSTTTTSDSDATTATTLSNNVDTSIANDSFSGRIDQQAVLNTLNKGLGRSLDMNAFRADGIRTENGRMYINGGSAKTAGQNGYNATSRLYGVGVEVNVDRDWAVGAQFNKVNTTLNGVDSTTGQDKTHFGLFSVLDIEGAKLVNNIGYAQNDIKSNRTIRGIDFNNSHSTTGSDLWTSVRLYSPDYAGFRPFVGGAVGRQQVGGYTEAGSIQSYRVVGSENTSYRYGEGGLRYEAKLDNFTAATELSATTDQFKTAAVSLAYDVNKHSVVAVTGQRQINPTVSTNLVNLTLMVRF
jgi:hypothetical protein